MQPETSRLRIRPGSQGSRVRPTRWMRKREEKIWRGSRMRAAGAALVQRRQRRRVGRCPWQQRRAAIAMKAIAMT
jgi:hypothetical protein